MYDPPWRPTWTAHSVRAGRPGRWRPGGRPGPPGRPRGAGAFPANSVGNTRVRLSARFPRRRPPAETARRQGRPPGVHSSGWGRSCARLRRARGLGRTAPSERRPPPGGESTLAVAATTRRAWQYRHVPTSFLTVEPGERLGAFLERARRAGAERVMLLGPAPDPAWLLSDPGPWQPDDRGHYLDTDQLCARYVMRSTLPPRIVARMELRRAVSWFGDGDYSAEVAMQAWATLEELIREVRGWETARLLGSPTVTGRDLWRRTIRPGASFPLLEVDQAALIRSTSPQARIQLVEPQRGELAEFHYLDMRLAYGALTRELPVGPARHDVATPGRPLAVQPYAAARYLVEFTAPAGWPWVGAFMVPGDEGRYTFPLAGVCWADCWEVENAVRHGWRVVVRERLSF